MAELAQWRREAVHASEADFLFVENASRVNVMRAMSSVRKKNGGSR